ncbi:MAG: peroxiredoxin-like family protein [Phycisphaerales bacterium]|nr:peroxiredoxin-like family protein [Phycisphaerales bacterium]
MNKAALYATLAVLPVLAYAPLSNAATDFQPSMKKVIKLEEPLQLGDKISNFEIENAMGGKIQLDTLLADGPVVLTFYRGSWCPYCRNELSAVQTRLSKITKAGGTVLAISPEVPEKTADLAEQKELGFLFGADHDNALAKQLALSFKLDAKTIKKYREYGIDLPESNDSKKWELPIPATYVIDTDHTIRFAFVEEDYSKRAKYDDVVDVLKEIQSESED